MFLPQASFYPLPHCYFVFSTSDLQRPRHLPVSIRPHWALNHVNSEISLTANLLSNGRFLSCEYFDGDERKYFLLFCKTHSSLRISTCIGCNCNFKKPCLFFCFDCRYSLITLEYNATPISPFSLAYVI